MFMNMQVFPVYCKCCDYLQTAVSPLKAFSSPCDPPLVPDKVFDNHSRFSSVVLGSQKNNHALCVMLSASKDLPCVHTAIRERNCVGTCICVSVNVLCASLALLSASQVWDKAVVFFVFFCSSFIFPCLLSVLFSAGLFFPDIVPFLYSFLLFEFNHYIFDKKKKKLFHQISDYTFVGSEVFGFTFWKEIANNNFRL